MQAELSVFSATMRRDQGGSAMDQAAVASMVESLKFDGRAGVMRAGSINDGAATLKDFEVFPKLHLGH